MFVNVCECCVHVQNRRPRRTLMIKQIDKAFDDGTFKYMSLKIVCVGSPFPLFKMRKKVIFFIPYLLTYSKVPVKLLKTESSQRFLLMSLNSHSPAPSQRFRRQPEVQRRKNNKSFLETIVSNK